MDKKTVEKILTIVYAISFFFLVISVAEAIFNNSFIDKYFDWPDYPDDEDGVVIRKVNKLFSTSLIYTIIGFVAVLIFLIFTFTTDCFKKKDSRKRSVIRLAILCAINAVIITMTVLLMVNSPKFTNAVTELDISHFSILSVRTSFAISARAIFLMPIVTMIIIFCLNIFYSIVNFVKMEHSIIKIKKASEPELSK